MPGQLARLRRTSLPAALAEALSRSTAAVSAVLRPPSSLSEGRRLPRDGGRPGSLQGMQLGSHDGAPLCLFWAGLACVSPLHTPAAADMPQARLGAARRLGPPPCSTAKYTGRRRRGAAPTCSERQTRKKATTFTTMSFTRRVCCGPAAHAGSGTAGPALRMPIPASRRCCSCRGGPRAEVAPCLGLLHSQGTNLSPT